MIPNVTNMQFHKNNPECTPMENSKENVTLLLPEEELRNEVGCIEEYKIANEKSSLAKILGQSAIQPNRCFPLLSNSAQTLS